MPATHTVDNKSRLIITTWEGDAVDTDFIEAIKKYQDEIQGSPDCVGYNEVVNFSKVSKIKLTTRGIKDIAQIASKTDHGGVARRLALIVNSDLAYGIARMYEGYRSFFPDANKTIRVFRDENDAFDWVNDSS